MSVDESFVPYRVAAHYLSERLKEHGIAMPTVGIICGSGLSELSKALDGRTLRCVCVRWKSTQTVAFRCFRFFLLMK